MPLAIISLILKILPRVLGLINKGLAYAHDQQTISLGAAQAMNAEAQRIAATLAQAKAAAQAADAAQAAHPNDDGGFDQSFERKD